MANIVTMKVDKAQALETKPIIGQILLNLRTKFSINDEALRRHSY